MYFDETQLNDNILDALYDMHFDECTPIQEQCIPRILEGRDIIGVAQTGTGKTAAYLLPVLSMLDDGYADFPDGRQVDFPKDAVNCLIMAPTRELAQQIDQAMQGFSYYLPDVGSDAIYGGNDGTRYAQELRSLQMGAEVIIATPGRLISHIQMGNADLSRVSFFILDEADRMLDMGFSDDILKIAKLLPPTCQTIMFSATMPKKIEDLAKTLLTNPAEVKIAVSKPAEKIQQSCYLCYEPQKLSILRQIFKNGNLERVIIFCGKKTKVKDIYHDLTRLGVNCGQMHSDLSQAERDEAMFQFKSGQVDVLVATDILSRGIDIDDIAMVINYDVPHDPEDYVHRIGRTARAQRDGVAITFVSDKDMNHFRLIEQFLDRRIDQNPLPEGCGEGPAYKEGLPKKSSGKRSFSRNGKKRGRGKGKGANKPKNDKKPKSENPPKGDDNKAKSGDSNPNTPIKPKDTPKGDSKPESRRRKPKNSGEQQ